MSKVPDDPTISKEMRSFLDDRERAENTLQDALDAAIAALPAFASQAEAEAGTSAIVTMSPLRTAQYYAVAKPKLIQVRHTVASGTPGGGSVTGSFLQLVLNTTVINQITGASLASNQITGLPAGDYYFEAEKIFFNTGLTQLKLYDATNSADILVGLSHSTTGAVVTTNATVSGPFTLAGTTTVDLRYRCSNTQNTNGLGVATSFGAENFADLKIWKI